MIFTINMNHTEIVTNHYQAKLWELMKQIDTNAFVTSDIYSEYCFNLTELTNFVATDRFTIERTKAKQVTAEIEYGQELKANRTGDKAITEAYISRCIDEKFAREHEANKIQDEYVKMLETMVKSYNQFAFTMYHTMKQEDNQNKANNWAMSMQDPF